MNQFHGLPFCLILLDILFLPSHGIRILDLLQKSKGILGAPKYLEDLPPGERIIPGHTLIKPSRGMLKSAARFPLRDSGNTAVYGNEATIGQPVGKRNQYILYTDFRKANVAATILQKLQELNRNNKYKYPVIIEIDRGRSSKKNHYKYSSENDDLTYEIPIDRDLTNEETNYKYDSAKDYSSFEILKNREDSSEEINGIKKIADVSQSQDILNNIEDSNEEKNLIKDFSYDDRISEVPDFRRKYKKHKSKSRHRDMYRQNSDGSTEESESSSSFEENPGNPFTIHNDKYKQNWPWNFKLDGNHVNINPFGPTFGTNAGPSGPDLFFGRKWWYFNQDDYIPLG